MRCPELNFQQVQVPEPNAAAPAKSRGVARRTAVAAALMLGAAAMTHDALDVMDDLVAPETTVFGGEDGVALTVLDVAAAPAFHADPSDHHWF